jgi:hypothetical protein
MTGLQQLRSLVLPEAQRQAFLHEVRGCLPQPHYERVQAMMELLPELLQLLEQKSMSIGRLRKLVFGATTESARNVCGGPPKEPPKRAKRRWAWSPRTAHLYRGRAREGASPNPQGRRLLSGLRERQTAASEETSHRRHGQRSAAGRRRDP